MPACSAFVVLPPEFDGHADAAAGNAGARRCCLKSTAADDRR